MTVKTKVRYLYAAVALTAFSCLAVAMASEALSFPFMYALLTVIPVAVGQFLIGCPTRGKNVFRVERGRAVGMSVGYYDFQAERVCSRCGTVLMSDSE